MKRTILGLALVSMVATSHTNAQEPSELARKARSILQTHCHRCHGDNGSVEGGVNYLLDRNQLVARRKIVPGQPGKSALLRRITLEEMPPEGEKSRPSADEVALLNRWIAEGAADFAAPIAPRAFVTPAAVIDTIATDLGKIAAADRRFMRYFTITHLHNAGLSEDELTSYRQAISRLVNSLSWGRRIVLPEPIDPARTILRVDLRELRWSTSTWDLLESQYPYGVVLDTTEETSARKDMGTQQCHLRGDWFVATAALPPLYHDILRLPMTARALEKQLLVDVPNNLADGLTLRAGFNGSGVSRNNRLIERHATLFGAYWKSYDFAGNTGAQNLFASPLGPDRRASSFKHDGGEIIFNLPNGMQAYMLVNATGQRIDKGPTEIVSDPRRPDRAVVNGLSCMSCHSRGIIAKEDQIRPHVEKNSQAFARDELPNILTLYVSQEKLRAAMDDDARRFREAVERTGGRVTTTEPIVALAARFESEMDLTSAACELGMPAAKLQGLFGRSVTLSRTLGPLAVEGGTVQRDVFREAFPQLVRELELGKAVPWRPKSAPVRWSANTEPKLWTPPIFTPPTLLPPDQRPQPVAPVVVKKKRTNHASGPQRTFDDPWYFRFPSHESGHLQAVAISSEKATASEGKVGVIMLTSVDGEVRTQFAGHTGNILSLDFAPNGRLLASGSLDQTARLWDVGTASERHLLGGHGGFVSTVRFAPGGKLLATGSERVRLFDVDTGAEKITFEKTPTWVSDLAFSPDGTRLAAASESVHLWEVSTGKLLARLDSDSGVARSVAFSPDGQFLAEGTEKGTIRLWKVADRSVHKLLQGHRLPVASLAFSHSGGLLLSAGGGRQGDVKLPGEFKVWDPANGQELASEAGHRGAVTCVAVSPDDKYAASTGLDGHLRYRDLMPHGKVALDPFEGHLLGILGLAVTADSRRAATTSYDSSLRIWDVASGRQLQRLDKIPVGSEVGISADQRTLVVCTQQTIRSLDIAMGKPMASFVVPGLLGAAPSGDARRIAGVCEGNRAEVWDVAERKKVRAFTDVQFIAALSHDGKRIALMSPKLGLAVWDVDSGEKIGTLTQQPITAAAFSSDGSRLLTGDANRYVCAWDVASGRELLRYKGHTEPVTAVGFAAGERKILAAGGGPGSGGQRFVVWDAASGAELQRFDTPHTTVRRFVVVQNTLVYVAGRTLRKITLP